MGQPSAPKALALGVSLSLACSMMPAAALADEPIPSEAASTEASASSAMQKPADYDKDDFYSDSSPKTRLARSIAMPYAVSLDPVAVSSEMKYFAKYESGRNYNQGLSYGDGYHAMGYYQFDNRYTLKGFLEACYAYDPETYHMFEWVSSTNISGDLYDESAGKLNSVGQRLEDSWHLAYAANPTEFSGLQDSYAYNNSYIPAQEYLASRGIDISNRSDAVKGLCWGLSSLFGSSGWKKFVGGVSDGYDRNGTYHYLSEGYDWPGAGLTNDMTDREFVTKLCNYVVENVSVFYKGQPQYHQGWENRYRNELKDCLAFITQHEQDAEASKPVPAPDPEPKPEVTPAPVPVPNPEPTPTPDEPSTPIEPAPSPNEPSTPAEPSTPSNPENGGSGENAPGNADRPGSEDTVAPTPPTGNENSTPEESTPGAETPNAPTPPDSSTGNGDQPTAGNGGSNEGSSSNADSQGSGNGPKQEVSGSGSGSKSEEPGATLTTEVSEASKTEAKPLPAPAKESKASNLTQTGDEGTSTPLVVALASACLALVAGAALTMRKLLGRG
ncbi:hypothetical protein [Paraeggerthella hongkongensis]|uniref:Type VI secretion system spike protein VgrG3-like C-terminal domain-containing protein n=2 Tax=Eggerthellaceae TaxID=1643826 RepID=A0A3N0BDT7_9ACTN|nr:hypothetical protein [Paraeggerthella hongkongensis]RNL45745.1 hypothetical protein DMP08_05325 [Paraeggerthella hongkongensis]